MRLLRALSRAALAGAVVLAACSDASHGPAGPDAPDALEARAGQNVDVIVVLERSFAPGGHAANQAAAVDVARGMGFSPVHAYGTALFGFSASVPEGRLNALDRDPRVAYWERDRVVSLPRPPNPGVQAPEWCSDPANADHPACSDGGDDEEPAGGEVEPWGVTRVGGPLDGSGNTAWIIDTGIDPDHADLNVDWARSENFVTRGKDSPEDKHGHGTHVAGTVAAVDNGIDVVGVAAGASVVAVRVLDNSGSGFLSWIEAGIDYVAANASSGDVANMSLGGSASGSEPNSMEDAILEAIEKKGISFSIAAGNSGDAAAGYTPARIGDDSDDVYTVSAIGQDDCLASFSNWGAPVDVAAPGVGVLSTAKGGGTTTMSGTSMAAPHVAGLLLLGVLHQDGTACADPDGVPDPIAHN